MSSWGIIPGSGILGRERIRRDLGARARQAGMKRRLARVRRPEQWDLCRALGANHQRRTAVRPAPLGSLELFGEFLDATLDVALEMVGPLVLGDHAQHLPQRLQALPGVARLAEGGLGGLVLGREVGGHGGVGDALRTGDLPPPQQEPRATRLFYVHVGAGSRSG